MPKKTSGLRPGQTAPRSGQCREIGPRGGTRREITLPKGHTVQPGKSKGATFDLVDLTDNTSGS